MGFVWLGLHIPQLQGWSLCRSKGVTETPRVCFLFPQAPLSHTCLPFLSLWVEKERKGTGSILRVTLGLLPWLPICSSQLRATQSKKLSLPRGRTCRTSTSLQKQLTNIMMATKGRRIWQLRREEATSHLSSQLSPEGWRTWGGWRGWIYPPPPHPSLPAPGNASFAK